MFARLRCGGNLPQCLAFGTGEGHLWYGICVPCSKRLLGGTRRIFGGTRCAKQPSTVRKGYSVPETPSYGTEGTLGARNRLLWYAMRFQKHLSFPEKS